MHSETEIAAILQEMTNLQGICEVLASYFTQLAFEQESRDNAGSNRNFGLSSILKDVGNRLETLGRHLVSGS